MSERLLSSDVGLSHCSRLRVQQLCLDDAAHRLVDTLHRDRAVLDGVLEAEVDVRLMRVLVADEHDI